MPFWRKVDRLRPLDEAAAYARCHGDRDESVRIVMLPPRRARYDLLATGGTALAAVRLVRRAGAEVVGARFVIDLPALGGGAVLADAGVETLSLMEFEGD